MTCEDDQTISTNLRGNTLRVYWHMLSKNEPVGVREVQRELGMSSPSVASHHLSRLVDMGLVTKRPDNTYELQRVVKVGILRDFIAYRGVLLPRYVFVAVFFTVYTITFIALALMVPVGLFDRVAAIAVGAVGASFAWYESVRLWKLKFT